MKTLFVAWQQPDSKEWIPVARLDYRAERYQFSYTRGAFRARDFVPFGQMDKLDRVYESSTLFPLFSNRLISRSRPEFKDHLRWLGLADMPDDPMTMLALTGGIRGTDQVELFSLPSITEDGEYQLDFFARGIRHLPKETIGLISSLQPGSKLFLMQDRQNPVDPYALALRSGDPVVFTGYCPKYYAKDLGLLLDDSNSGLEAHVKSINADAPLNMRLLCSITAKLSSQFTLFDTELDFEPITDSVDALPSAWHRLSLDLELRRTQ